MAKKRTNISSFTDFSEVLNSYLGKDGKLDVRKLLDNYSYSSDLLNISPDGLAPRFINIAYVLLAYQNLMENNVSSVINILCRIDLSIFSKHPELLDVFDNYWYQLFSSDELNSVIKENQKLALFVDNCFDNILQAICATYIDNIKSGQVRVKNKKAKLAIIALENLYDLCSRMPDKRLLVASQLLSYYERIGDFQSATRYRDTSDQLPHLALQELLKQLNDLIANLPPEANVEISDYQLERITGLVISILQRDPQEADLESLRSLVGDKILAQIFTKNVSEVVDYITIARMDKGFVSIVALKYLINNSAELSKAIINNPYYLDLFWQNLSLDKMFAFYREHEHDFSNRAKKHFDVASIIKGGDDVVKMQKVLTRKNIGTFLEISRDGSDHELDGMLGILNYLANKADSDNEQAGEYQALYQNVLCYVLQYRDIQSMNGFAYIDDGKKYYPLLEQSVHDLPMLADKLNEFPEAMQCLIAQQFLRCVTEVRVGEVARKVDPNEEQSQQKQVVPIPPIEFSEEQVAKLLGALSPEDAAKLLAELKDPVKKPRKFNFLFGGGKEKLAPGEAGCLALASRVIMVAICDVIKDSEAKRALLVRLDAASLQRLFVRIIAERRFDLLEDVIIAKPRVLNQVLIACDQKTICALVKLILDNDGGPVKLLFKGRTKDVKRRLANAIVSDLETCGQLIARDSGLLKHIAGYLPTDELRLSIQMLVIGMTEPNEVVEQLMVYLFAKEAKKTAAWFAGSKACWKFISNELKLEIFNELSTNAVCELIDFRLNEDNEYREISDNDYGLLLQIALTTKQKFVAQDIVKFYLGLATKKNKSLQEKALCLLLTKAVLRDIDTVNDKLKQVYRADQQDRIMRSMVALLSDKKDIQDIFKVTKNERLRELLADKALEKMSATGDESYLNDNILLYLLAENSDSLLISYKSLQGKAKLPRLVYALNRAIREDLDINYAKVINSFNLAEKDKTALKKWVKIKLRENNSVRARSALRDLQEDNSKAKTGSSRVIVRVKKLIQHAKDRVQSIVPNLIAQRFRALFAVAKTKMYKMRSPGWCDKDLRLMNERLREKSREYQAQIEKIETAFDNFQTTLDKIAKNRCQGGARSTSDIAKELLAHPKSEQNRRRDVLKDDGWMSENDENENGTSQEKHIDTYGDGAFPVDVSVPVPC